MNLTRFWQHNIRWTLILWFIAAFWLRTGLPIFIIGVAAWFVLVYFTAPGVFWTYVYALPFNSSNSERTIKVLQKAVGYKPLIPLPYTALGIAYVRAKRWEEALPLLEEAVRLADRKSIPDIKTILAVAYRETGEYSKTYALLDELVSQGVQNLKIYYNYALCFLRQARYNEALEAAEKARSFDANLLEPVLLLGQIQFEQGEIQAAKDNWEWAINRNQRLIEPFYWLGRAELALGQKEAALTHLRLAVDRITNNPLLSNVSAAEAEEWLKKAEAGKE